MSKLEKTQEDIFKRKFKSALLKSERPPFIFAGSGVSINYYGIPTWINLLKAFVENNTKFTLEAYMLGHIKLEHQN